MPVIYSGTNDGYAAAGANTNFIAARSNAGGYYNSTSSRSSMASIIAAPGRGGAELHDMLRGFFEFDTSGITVTPTSATLDIYGDSTGTADVIAVRSEQGGTLSAGDFDALYGASTQLAASDGSGAGTLAGVSGLTYSSELATWSTSGYNTISLNATALHDMASLDTFKVCVMEYDHDYLDIAATLTTILISRAYFANYSGTSRDPKIDYTAGTAAVADNATFFGTNF